MIKRPNIYSSYPEEFRQEVVEQVLSGKMSGNQTRHHYGMGGKMTVHNWVKRHLELEKRTLGFVERRSQAQTPPFGREPLFPTRRHHN